MTDPAAARDYLHHDACGSHTRRDVAGNPPRCFACGHLLVDAVAADEQHQVVEPVKSPIVARHRYLSPSARRAEQAAGTTP